MKSLGFLLLVGCTSTDIRSELAAVDRLLADRGASALAPLKHDAFAPVSVAGPLGVEDAARLALANDHTLQAAIAELGISRGAAVEAGAWPTPTLEAGFSRGLEGKEDSPDVEVAVEYDLSRLLLTGGRSRIAEAEGRAARWALAGQVLETGLRTRQAFWSARAAGRVLEIEVQALRNQQAAWVVAEEVYRAGGSDDLTHARQQAAIEAARLAVSRAELRQAAALEALKVRLGVMGPLALQGRLPDPPETSIDAADLEQRALENSLDLAALRDRLEAAAGRVDHASARTWLPRLTIGAHADREDDEWEAGGHIAFGLPLLDEGQGAEARAEAELLGLRHRYMQAAIDLRAAARMAWTTTESLRQQALHLRDVVLPAQDRVLAESQKAYNAMQIDVFRLLEAQRARLATAVAYVEALDGFWQARLTLDTLLAGRQVGLTSAFQTTSPEPAPTTEAH